MTTNLLRDAVPGVGQRVVRGHGISRLSIGDRMGSYVVTGVLSEGDMSVVYRASHALLGRAVAIKVLRRGDLHDRFLGEARATSAVRHRGIVEVYDHGYTEHGAAYITMELVEGTTLRERLERGTLSVVEALMIARRIASPLAVAHEAGIAHRDLTLDNVFLIRDPEGGAHEQVKLLDFEVARDHQNDLDGLGCILDELQLGRAISRLQSARDIVVEIDRLLAIPGPRPRATLRPWRRTSHPVLAVGSVVSIPCDRVRGRGSI